MPALAVAFAWLLASLPTPSAVPVRTVVLTPVEFASAYTYQCGGAPQPPYLHPPSTVFVGGWTGVRQPGAFVGGAAARAATICSVYQGLVRFDLDGLDAASISSARLFYESKQNYFVDGTTDRNRALCIGGIGVTAQSWSSDEKSITPVLEEVDALRPPHANFKSPPIDITALLRAHLEDVKANGLTLDGTVENVSTRHCLAAIGHLELRLAISGAL